MNIINVLKINFFVLIVISVSFSVSSAQNVLISSFYDINERQNEFTKRIESDVIDIIMYTDYNITVCKSQTTFHANRKPLNLAKNRTKFIVEGDIIIDKDSIILLINITDVYNFMTSRVDTIYLSRSVYSSKKIRRYLMQETILKNISSNQDINFKGITLESALSEIQRRENTLDEILYVGYNEYSTRPFVRSIVFNYIEKYISENFTHEELQFIFSDNYPLEQNLIREFIKDPMIKKESIWEDMSGFHEIYKNNCFEALINSTPVFPVPVPKSSAMWAINPNYFHGCKTLFDIKDRIESSLNLCGYHEKSYYNVENGFALVTRIEKITEDVQPFEVPERWSFEHKNKDKSFSLGDYFKTLFFAEEGKYRIIVFVVTNKAFTQSTEAMEIREATNYLKRGYTTLPDEFKYQLYGKSYECTALIYEFDTKYKQNGVLVENSNYTGHYHLTKNNFLQTLHAR